MFFGCFRRCLEHQWENGRKIILNWIFEMIIIKIDTNFQTIYLGSVSTYSAWDSKSRSIAVVAPLFHHHQLFIRQWKRACQTHGIQCHFLRKSSAKVWNHFGRLLCSFKGFWDIFFLQRWILGLKMLIVKSKNSAELTTLCFRRKPESNSRRELLTNKMSETRDQEKF